jgi:hypothetical protein
MKFKELTIKLIFKITLIPIKNLLINNFQPTNKVSVHKKFLKLLYGKDLINYLKENLMPYFKIKFNHLILNKVN